MQTFLMGLAFFCNFFYRKLLPAFPCILSYRCFANSNSAVSQYPSVCVSNETQRPDAGSNSSQDLLSDSTRSLATRLWRAVSAGDCSHCTGKYQWWSIHVESLPLHAMCSTRFLSLDVDQWTHLHVRSAHWHRHIDSDSGYRGIWLRSHFATQYVPTRISSSANGIS